MTTQVQISTAPLYSLEFIVLEENPPAEPQQYTAYDFGYEVDQDEVGEWMAAEYSNGSFDLTPQVEPDEFETLNHWFLS
jgi:hypothetical protein